MYLYNFLNDNERNIKKKEKNCNKVAKAKTNCMVHIRNEPLAIFLNVSSSLKCQKWKLSLTLMLYNNIHSVFCLLLIYLLHVYIPFSMRFFLPSLSIILFDLESYYLFTYSIIFCRWRPW